jgi:K+-sensing histidine kinase KdpD
MQIKRDWKSPLWHSVAQGFFGGIALALVTLACFRLGLDLATAAFAYLIVIVVLSLMGSFYVSAVLSIIAVAALNYFFALPNFNFRVEEPQDAVLVIAFLLTSLIVTGLKPDGRNAQSRGRIAAVAGGACSRHSRDDLGRADLLDSTRSESAARRNR